MKCQSNNCETEATHHLFRPATGPIRKDANKRPIWNQTLMTCDICQPAAQTECMYESSVPPDKYEVYDCCP